MQGLGGHNPYGTNWYSPAPGYGSRSPFRERQKGRDPTLTLNPHRRHLLWKHHDEQGGDRHQTADQLGTRPVDGLATGGSSGEAEVDYGVNDFLVLMRRSRENTRNAQLSGRFFPQAPQHSYASSTVPRTDWLSAEYGTVSAASANATNDWQLVRTEGSGEQDQPISITLVAVVASILPVVILTVCIGLWKRGTRLQHDDRSLGLHIERPRSVTQPLLTPYLKLPVDTIHYNWRKSHETSPQPEQVLVTEMHRINVLMCSEQFPLGPSSALSLSAVGRPDLGGDLEAIASTSNCGHEKNLHIMTSSGRPVDLESLRDVKLASSIDQMDI